MTSTVLQTTESISTFSIERMYCDNQLILLISLLVDNAVAVVAAVVAVIMLLLLVLS